MVGAGSVVTTDVAARTVVFGVARAVLRATSPTRAARARSDDRGRRRGRRGAGGGGAVVALESTIIAHGLPAPRQRARSRARSRTRCARSGAVPATIALLDGDGARRARRRRARRGRRRATTSPSAARATCRSRRRGGATGATTVAATAHVAARAGHPACSRPAGSAACTARRRRRGTSRPTSSRSRAPAICVVCAGVKSILDVARDARAAGDARGRRRRLRHRPLPGLLPRRLRPSRCRGGSTRRSEVAAALRARDELGLDSALVRRQPARRAARPRAARARARRGARGRRARGHPRARRDAVPARALPRARPAARACARTCALVLRNAELAAQIAVAARAMSRSIVVGDLMADVVAWASAPLAHASDTPAADHRAARAAAAPTSPRGWPTPGVPTLLVARVGDDTAGPGRGRRAARARASSSRSPSTRCAPTGTCVVIVEPGGERTMLPDRGANAALEPADLPDRRVRRGRRTSTSPATRCSTPARAPPGWSRSSTRARRA